MSTGIWKSCGISIASAAVMLASMTEARADEKLIYHAGSDLGDFAEKVKGITTGSHWRDIDPQVCWDTIKKHADKGVKSTDLLKDKDFQHSPGVANGAYAKDGFHYIAFSDASKVCKDYERLRNAAIAIEPLLEYGSRLGIVNGMKAGEAGETFGATYAKFGEQCLLDVDKAIADGAEPDVAVWVEGGLLSLADLRKEYCQALIDVGTSFSAATISHNKAEADRIAKRWAGTGIKGDRLALFMEYDGLEWLLPGCDDSTDEPKRLKKAKKLFQWLTAPDGQITVRKFTFKGDKYKVTEKYFYSEEAAYRACK